METESPRLTDSPVGSAAPEAVRCGLDWSFGVSELLRRLAGRKRRCALVGEWASGGAIIACDPIESATSISALSRWPVPTRPSPGTRMIGGAWIGLLGFQVARELETLPPPPPRMHEGPHCDLAFYDHLLRRDPAGKWWLESVASADRTAMLLERYRVLAAGPEPEPAGFDIGDLTMQPSPAGHLRTVERVLDLIRRGEIFQANLAVHLSARFGGDPAEVFCAGVAALAPAYAAFTELETGAVASFSPELFLRRRERHVLTSPIKGTAPIGVQPEILAASGKNRAENVMIVDLMRNDLSRVCEPWSVVVPTGPRVETHAGVWHMITDVRGRLRPEVTNADLVRATFPPGSVTGAPKVRALEVINEFEPVARHAYTGSIGWSALDGMEFNVAIRTFEFGGERIRLGVGGGIVADSTPRGELGECLHKAEPLLSAIGARLAPALRAELDAALAVRRGADPIAEPAPNDRSTAVRVVTSAVVPTTVALSSSRPRVLLLDNYDSFVHNLARYCAELGATTEVVRNDAMTVDEIVSAIARGSMDRVLISPGPGGPLDAGISVELIRRLAGSVPILGVCLGHQCIGEAFGARTVRAPRVVHGSASLMYHDGAGLFAGVKQPFWMGRYHSLVLDETTLPPQLLVTARDASGLVMGVRHSRYRIEGLQGHPESVLTEHGHEMLANFLTTQ